MLSCKITNALCNLQCDYCYEHIYRSTVNQRQLDLEAIKNQIRIENEAPYLHGGEALLAPLEVLEEILSISYKYNGHSSIQTNGVLINDKHIELFKKYNTYVGVSIDGPGELSKYRKSLSGDRNMGDVIMGKIRKLREAGIEVGIICVLSTANALPEQREAFKEWVRELKELRITGRMNPAEVDYPSLQHIALTPEQLEDFYRDMARFILTEIGGDWLPFRDIVDSLMGLNQGTCVFGDCDYYNATAEKVILSDGTTASCMKTSKTGHLYPRFQDDGNGFAKIRYEILPLIDKESGGCKGCKYWRNCMGGCPAEGVDGDWRNKTRFCQAYYGLFEEVSTILKRILPNIILTSDEGQSFPSQRTVEGMYPPATAYMTPGYVQAPSSWRQDTRGSAISPYVQVQPGCPEGYTQQPEGYTQQVVAEVEDFGHGDRPHGDAPHGDHVDHGDAWA